MVGRKRRVYRQLYPPPPAPEHHQDRCGRGGEDIGRELCSSRALNSCCCCESRFGKSQLSATDNYNERHDHVTQRNWRTAEGGCPDVLDASGSRPLPELNLVYPLSESPRIESSQAAAGIRPALCRPSRFS